MTRFASLFFAFATLLAACASVQSRNANTGGVGLAYMAPMRLLTVTATRAPALDDEKQAAIDRLRAAFTAASTAVTNQTNAVDALTVQAATLRAAVAAAADSAKAAAETAAAAKERERDAAGVLLRILRTRQTQAEQTYITELHQALGNATQWGETIQIAMGPAVGDPSRRFTADLSSSPFRSDRGKIVIGANGLLQSADLTFEGRVGEVVLGVTESLVSIAAAGGGNSSRDRPTAAQAPAPHCDSDGLLTAGFDKTNPVRQTLTLTFDPTQREDVRIVNVALCRLGFTYRLAPAVSGVRGTPDQVSGWRGQPASGQRSSNGLECVNVDGNCPGLVYRQSEPFSLNVQRINTACHLDSGRWVDDGVANDATAAFRARREPCEPYIVQNLNFSIPNGAPLNVLPYSSAYFVSRHDNVAFVDGALTSIDFDHPSEAAVAARLPGQVLRTVASSISSIVQLRIDLSNKEAERARAEQELAETRIADPSDAHVARLQNLQRILELQEQIAQLQQRLRDAQSNSPTPPSPPPG